MSDILDDLKMMADKIDDENCSEPDPLALLLIRAIAEIRKLREQPHHTTDGAAGAVDMIADELRRAVAKFPTWPTDPLHALAVLGEEFGELTKAVLQATYEPHKSTKNDVCIEAIQTAAMALRFISSLERYEYAHCAQHEQEGANA